MDLSLLLAVQSRATLAQRYSEFETSNLGLMAPDLNPSCHHQDLAGLLAEFQPDLRGGSSELRLVLEILASSNLSRSWAVDTGGNSDVDTGGIDDEKYFVFVEVLLFVFLFLQAQHRFLNSKNR